MNESRCTSGPSLVGRTGRVAVLFVESTDPRLKPAAASSLKTSQTRRQAAESFAVDLAERENGVA